MNVTIALPALVAELAKTNNCPDETASEFLHALARVVSKGLAEDGTVTIKGIGIFKIIDKPGGAEVDFLPDEELAAEVNAPFSLFEPVELAAGVSAADLDADVPVRETEIAAVAEETVTTEPSQATVVEEPVVPAAQPAVTATREACGAPEIPAGLPPIPPSETPVPEVNTPQAGQTAAEPAATPVREQNSRPAPEPVSEPEPDRRPAPEPRTINETYSQTTRTYTESTPHHVREERIVKVVDRRPNKSAVALAAVIALVAGLAIGYLAYGWINFNGPRNVEISAEKVNVHPAVPVVIETDTTATEVAPTDSAKTADATETQPVAQPATPAAKSPAIVTDTVGGRRYLSVIARQHYGKDIFWVYIYEENKEHISNPNNVPEGLVVVIPPAEKYNIDPKSKESVHAAERKAYLIMQGRQ